MRRNKADDVTTLPPSPDQPNAADIGVILRSARLARGISLIELQARTKIGTGYLVALEEGRFGALPPLAFTRGFLRTVAGELGVDPEPLVRSLNAAMATEGGERLEHWQRVGSAVVPVTTMSPLKRRVISLGLVALLLALAAVFLLTRQLWEFAQPVPPAAPPEGVATPAAPVPIPSPVVGPPETQTRSGATLADQEVTVEVQASGRSWLLVQTAAGPLFQGFINAGGAMRWQSKTPISLRAGNAGAITVIVNGSALGTYGRPGEVVDRTFQPGAPP
ncbi:MAG: helix-turn-helix domain-containing protein [bacterium]|nr:helix-turn-helix domain-containing protein [bacterium]